MLANFSVILVYQTKLINFLKPKKLVNLSLLIIGLNKKKESLLEQKVVSI